MSDGVVLVDLGRSHVRVVCGDVDTRSDGGAGLSDHGPAAAAALVASAVRPACPDLAGARLAVGAPGVVTAPELAAEFAHALRSALPVAQVLVVSDSAAWQAGAFGGRDGAVVAVGTGAVTVARHDGRVRRLDGRGLLLGDVGGGAWIGLRALRLAARVTGSPLHEAAVARFGASGRWPDLLGHRDLAARLAAFAADVIALADGGDTGGGTVLDAAAEGLARTLDPLPAALAACLVGGLAPALDGRLRAASERTWVAAAGDAVDGLRALLDDAGPFAAEAVRLDAPKDGGGTTPPHDTDILPTERVADGTADLDTWPTARLVARLAAGHDTAVPAVLAAAAPLAAAADLVAGALADDGRLVYVGAGTPGRLAVQDAAELVPTFGLDPGRAVVLLAGGAQAGAQAIENAEDDSTAGARDVDVLAVGARDVVVGISASGRTPYVRAALARARELGAATVGISNVPGSPLGREADLAVDLATGPEVLAGSTRLAAGTAQKIALNTISTAALIRAGKTFGPFMVDVLATNDKLRRRSERIVRDAARVPDDVAVTALREADGSVPVALVALLAGVDPATARARLAERGSVRAAVAGDER